MSVPWSVQFRLKSLFQVYIPQSTSQIFRVAHILHSADEEKKLCWAEVCAIVFSQERTQEDPGEGPGEPGPPYFRPK